LSTQTEVRAYKPVMPTGWWTRKRHYFWYMVREFTALPLAVWLLWLLFDIYRAPSYQLAGPQNAAFVVFSIICLPFALYHSYTFLSLAGSIIHLRLFDRPVSSRVIVASQFALWIGASIVIGLLLVWLGQ
jgi:fumarate reductase subunit C